LVTRFTVEESQFESLQGQKIISHTSRLAIVHTQPYIQWVPVVWRQGREVHHWFYQQPMLTISGAIIPLRRLPFRRVHDTFFKIISDVVLEFAAL
jgi:hypothetical protein